jgi:hypothetical protein
VISGGDYEFPALHAGSDPNPQASAISAKQMGLDHEVLGHVDAACEKPVVRWCQRP